MFKLRCEWGFNLIFVALNLTFIRGHKAFPVFMQVERLSD